MKMLRIGRWLLSFALLFACTLTHAEGGCPPGMIPHSGTDISSCGPIPPGYNQPQGYWEDRWAAVAVSDNSKGGFASDQPNEDAAKKSSIDNCIARGGIHCTVNVTYKNGCIAVVNGDEENNGSHFTIATAGTLDAAIKEGLKVCSTWGKNTCEVFRTTCGLPKWTSN